MVSRRHGNQGGVSVVKRGGGVVCCHGDVVTWRCYNLVVFVVDRDVIVYTSGHVLRCFATGSRLTLAIDRFTCQPSQ